MMTQPDGTVAGAIAYLKARGKWQGADDTQWRPRSAAKTNVARTFIEVAKETADSDEPLIITPGLRRLASVTRKR
jgi:hypothetical protein